jgi:hypothetical protein
MLDYHLNSTLHTPSKLPPPMPEEKSKNSGMGGTCLLPFNASKQTEREQNATERRKKFPPKNCQASGNMLKYKYKYSIYKEIDHDNYNEHRKYRRRGQGDRPV